MKVPGGYGRVLYVHNVEDGGNKNHWLRALSEEKNVLLDIDMVWVLRILRILLIV
ncbi:hypothetical protein WOSG25_071450 [Weissella oryzae SG25]|uniref:Uncharacterized protein n=1 Tax=Weissella oryzae (strain DSM 25784 / JCM 18191 / LMG 30913 / SG25) TaxID=1329250 RepID=A0A069CVA8_WEIOS|nr:hypothetical protein WOSG25_071450 [Weissella oryzae SG25]